MGLNVRIKHMENPRIEPEEHYYNPRHTGLLDLGLQPHYLTDDALAAMMELVAKYAAVLLAGDYAYGGVFVARARRAGLRILEYPIPVYPRAGGRTFHSRCRVFWVAIRFLLAGRGGCAGGGV